jgi:hypothetical protein
VAVAFLQDLPRLTAPLRRNVTAKLFAIGFAFILWFFVNAGERDTQVFQFPLELRNVPERSMIVNDDRVDTVAVKLNGPSLLLASLDTRRVPTLVDVARVTLGEETRIKIRDDMIRVPRGVRILDVGPSRIPLRLEEVRRTTLPVSVATTGAPRGGYRVETMTVTPERVTVTGPAHVLDRLKAIETEPIEIRDLSAAVQRTVGVVRGEQLIAVRPERVIVDLAVAPIVVSREFKRLTVEVRNVDRPFQLRPARVNVTVRGPERTVDELRLDGGSVFVDGTNLGPGEHVLRPEVVLPQGVELVKREPQDVRLEIVEQRSGARR